jgi:hypothetical protein
MQFLSGKPEGGAGPRSKPAGSSGNAPARFADNGFEAQQNGYPAQQEDMHTSEIHEEPLYQGEEMPF